MGNLLCSNLSSPGQVKRELHNTHIGNLLCSNLSSPGQVKRELDAFRVEVADIYMDML